LAVRLAQVLFWVAAFLLLVSCGKKTNPRPPEAVRPKPPEKVEVALHFWGAELTFKIPHQKIDGHPLPKLKSFQILRLGESLEGPEARFEKRIEIPICEEGFERLKYFVYHDRDLRSGTLYVYVIRAVRGWRCVSDPVRSPAFSWHTPPAAPKGLKAQGKDSLVVLSWQPIKHFRDGSPLKGGLKYRLYRRFPEGPFKALAGLIERPSFEDHEVKNENTYCYRVAGVYEYFGSLIEGPPSKEACATPHDLTPPRPPALVTAIPFRGGVLVKWRRNTEEDLLGYLVFREKAGEKPLKLTPEPISETTFFDAQLPGPGIYYYWVVAVDSSPRRNQSPPSEKVPVEISPKEVH